MSEYPYALAGTAALLGSLAAGAILVGIGRWKEGIGIWDVRYLGGTAVMAAAAVGLVASTGREVAPYLTESGAWLLVGLLGAGLVAASWRALTEENNAT